MSQAGDPGLVMAHQIEMRSALMVIPIAWGVLYERNLMMKK
jgi:hypothetical protein